MSATVQSLLDMFTPSQLDPQMILDTLQRLLAFMGIVVALVAIPYYTYKLMKGARPPLVIENQHPVNDYYG